MSEEGEVTKPPVTEEVHEHRKCSLCQKIHDYKIMDDADYHDFKKAVITADQRVEKGLSYMEFYRE